MPTGLPGLPSDAFAGYHFSIECDGLTIAQFQEVSGIASEVKVIDLQENTKDGKPVTHKLPGIVTPPTITFKRAKNSSKDLWDWHEKIRQGKVSDARKNCSLVLYNYDHSEVGRYNFTNAWPSKVSMSSAKASANEILMEEVTLVCEAVERVK